MNIELKHKSLRIEIEPENGAIAAFWFGGDNLMLRGARSSFSLTVDGETVGDWRLVGHSTAKIDNGLEAALEYRSALLDGVRIWQIFDLYGDAGRVERWIHVAGKRGERRKLEASTLSLAGLTAGDPDTTKVMARDESSAEWTLGEAAQRTEEGGTLDGTSPVDTYGLVTFNRPAPPLTIAVLPMAEEFRVTTSVFGNGEQAQRLTVTSRFAVNAFLGGDETITAGEQLIQVRQESGDGLLRAVAKVLAQRGTVSPDDRPEWLQGASVSVVERTASHDDIAKAKAAGYRVAASLALEAEHSNVSVIDDAKRLVRELGADAILVAVPPTGAPLWDESEGAPQPYETAYSVFPLLDELREALREIRPDIALVGATSGPEMVRRCDAVVTGDAEILALLGGWGVRVV